MTYKETLERASDILNTGAYVGTYFECDDLVNICIALEKQIPMKPFHAHKNYYCPTCKEGGWMMWDDAVPVETDSYCGICGQAIDWEGVRVVKILPSDVRGD